MSSNLKWEFELFPKALPHYLPIALTAAATADFGNTIQSKFFNIPGCSVLGPQYITGKLLAYGYFPYHCHVVYTLVCHSSHTATVQLQQEIQVHSTVVTLDFHSLPAHGRRHKYTDLWEHLSSTTKFECEILCSYATWSVDGISCEQR